MIDLFNLTPADIGILAAALDVATHLGDDDAVDLLAWTVESQIGLDPSEAEQLAYAIVHEHGRKLPA